MWQSPGGLRRNCGGTRRRVFEVASRLEAARQCGTERRTCSFASEEEWFQSLQEGTNGRERDDRWDSQVFLRLNQLYASWRGSSMSLSESQPLRRPWRKVPSNRVSLHLFENHEPTELCLVACPIDLLHLDRPHTAHHRPLWRLFSHLTPCLLPSFYVSLLYAGAAPH